MNTKELKKEVERTISDTLEIINLRKIQIKRLQDAIKNEDLRLQHFRVRLTELDYEKSK